MVTWPTIRWPGGTQPVLSIVPGGLNTFSFFSPDGGTTWLAIHPGTEHVMPNGAI
jgi:hypothetical protein